MNNIQCVAKRKTHCDKTKLEKVLYKRRKMSEPTKTAMRTIKMVEVWGGNATNKRSKCIHTHVMCVFVCILDSVRCYFSNALFPFFFLSFIRDFLLLLLLLLFVGFLSGAMLQSSTRIIQLASEIGTFQDENTEEKKRMNEERKKQQIYITKKYKITKMYI